MVYTRKFFALNYSLCQDMLGPHSLLKCTKLQTNLYDDFLSRHIGIVCVFSMYLAWYLVSFLFYFLFEYVCVSVNVCYMCAGVINVRRLS